MVVLKDPSIRSVLKNFDLPFRFRLGQRCPKIKKIDGYNILKLQSMYFAPHEFKADNFLFKLGVVRGYPNQSVPEHIRIQNESGGLRYDVDKYGLRIEGEVINKLKDEIMIDGGGGHTMQQGEEEERQVAQWEQDLANLERDRNNRRGNSFTVAERDILGSLEIRINDLREKLLPYHLQRDDGEPPYTHYIKLTIIEKKGRNVKESYEYVEYTQQLHYAMKYVLSQLFDDRNQYTPIEAQKLTLYTFGRIRLPTALRLIPIELRITKYGAENLEAIRPLISRRAIPFQRLVLSESGPFENSLIETADIVILQGSGYTLKLNECSLTRVHVSRSVISKTAVFDLIKHWIRMQQSPGCCFTFKVVQGSREDVHKIIDSIRTYDGAQVEEPEELRDTPFPIRVVINLPKHKADLKVFCVKDPTLFNMYTLFVETQNLKKVEDEHKDEQSSSTAQ